jgi:tetratricopeptide (TPR) repeat protein
MFRRKGRGNTRLTRSHRLPASTSGKSRAWLPALAVLLIAVMTAACPPPIIRVDVPSENIVRANQVALEADLAFARRDFYAALIKYLEAGRLNPNSHYIQNKIGIAYSQLKYWADASNAFMRSIGLNPKYEYSYNNLGTVYFATGDKKRAERYFRKAIGLNGGVASFHVNLGTLYFEKKNLDKAMAEWKRGLMIDPGIMNRSEGISLSAAGNRTNTGEKSYFIARLYASQGDVERAVENLQLALNAGFTNIDAIRSERDFDPIRQAERFQTFMKTAAVLSKP